MKLKYAHGIVSGISSIEQETECQDKIKIKIINENEAAVLVLADYTGMIENYGFHAELSADTVAIFVSENFDELYISEDEYTKKMIRDHIIKSLQESGIEPPGMDGSLLFTAVKDGRYLAAHFGDGLIVRLNGNCTVLSMSDNGLVNNEIYSASEDDERANLRIYKGDMQEPFGFMLLSGGACQSLYDYGTGNLSSACGTFFEWLKEYDEETVGEALVDNIGKYFKKDTKGDICIAVMVSDKDDSAKRCRKNKDLKYIIIAMLVVLIIIISKLIQPAVIEPTDKDKVDPKPSNPPITNSVDYEPSVTFSVENPKSFEPGEYKAGVDIPAGEYFFWTGEMLKPDSIVVNDDTCLSGELYCMTIQLNEWDTLVSDYRFTAAENVNPVKATDGVLMSGKYKIGKDIAPGKYTVSLTKNNTAGKYYSVLDGEISNKTEFTEDTTVEVPEAGYIVFYNSVLMVGQK